MNPAIILGFLGHKTLFARPVGVCSPFALSARHNELTTPRMQWSNVTIVSAMWHSRLQPIHPWTYLPLPTAQFPTSTLSHLHYETHPIMSRYQISPLHSAVKPAHHIFNTTRKMAVVPQILPPSAFSTSTTRTHQ